VWLSACGSSTGVTAGLLRQVPAAVARAAPSAPVVTTPPPPPVLAPFAPVPVRHLASTSPIVAAHAVNRPAPRPRPRPVDDTLFTIQIPRIGLVANVHDGESLAVLARGPGHHPGSALPGQVGNVVVPGHRTVSPHPFLNIDQIQQGDQIVLADGDGRFVYEVTSTTIVSPDDTSIEDPTTIPTLTLYACHPKGSDAQRYVVFGRLVAPANNPPPPPSQGSPPPQNDATPPPSCGFIPCIHR
jgi:sortase A